MSALLFYVRCLDRFGTTEVFFFVDLNTTIGADKLGVFIERVDFCAGFGRLHLTHMQLAMFLGI